MPQVQKEITALRVALISDPVGTGPTLSNRRPSMPDPPPPGQDDPHPYIGNDTNYCTAVDCMAAFYYQAVLRYLIDLHTVGVSENADATKKDLDSVKHNVTEPPNEGIQQTSIDYREKPSGVHTDGAKVVTNVDFLVEHGAMKQLSEELAEPQKSRKENIDYHVRASTESNRIHILQVEENVRLLAWNLLWNSQAEHAKLVVTLRYIQHAVAKLIAQHKQHIKDPNTEDCKDSELDCLPPHDELLLPMSTSQLQRSVSGEYIHMKPGTLMMSGESEETAIERPQSASPEYEMMIDPAHVCHSNQEGVQTEKPEGEHTENIGDDCSNTNIEYKESIESTKETNIETEDITMTTRHSMGLSKKRSSCNLDGALRPRYSEVDEDWYSMPVETRYGCECVTLAVLTQEQHWVNSLLHDMACKLQVSFTLLCHVKVIITWKTR